MDKAKKTKLKRIIAAVCAVAVVAVLAAMPLIAKSEAEKDGPQASILSGTVQMGSIDTELIGGGQLAEEDAISVKIPASVKLTRFFVENGQAVTEGEAIAGVDRVTVMTAIAEVQDTLDILAEEIEAESEKDTNSTVTALAGGTVKILYAEKGESVQDVMLDHGALAVLSLDGLMAVDLTVEESVAVGTAVTVKLSDGTEAEGKVTLSLGGNITVTIEDDDYPVGDEVEVEGLGSGQLYIYSPWNATAYAGTISAVKVSEGRTVKAGDTLMTLSDVGYTAAYRQLVAQRQAYEELMMNLFEMYQTETITAPCDGVVSGVDKNSVQLLSNTQQFTLSLLANAPSGNDEMVYTNFSAKVVSAAEGQWNLLVNPEPQDVTDYKDLSGVSIREEAMTQEASLAADIPVYVLVKGDWKQTDAKAGDILLIAFDDAANPVWAVRIAEAADDPEPPTEPEQPTEPSEPVEPPTEPDVPDEPTIPNEPTTPSEPTIPNDPTMPSEPTIPDTPTNPSNPGSGNFPSGGGNWGDMNGTGSMGNMSGMGSSGISGITGMDGFLPQEEPTVELYGMDMAQIAAVTPQDTMTLEITVDELDIRALQMGMAAEVKINALGGEKFTAAITSVSNTGANNGGSSKFTVELTMERAENMLVGMNASVSLVLNTTVDTLTIPASALVEEGTKTLVYTGYDAENECLTSPVEVTTGVSDGENVQILEGLTDGDSYYYAYYDTLEISYTPDFGGGGMMFGR